MDNQNALYNHLGHWSNLICELSSTGHAVALGLFTTEGKLLYANGPMCYYLNTNETELQPQNFFVNPQFDSFVQGEGLVFEGYTTIGNYADSSFVLLAKVYKQADQVFVFAEPNVPELFENNLKLSELNQQVNNLQRQLIKEKKTLELTLTKLKETQQMLIHSEKMNALGKLVAGVAHEINNPIAFVFSNLHSMGNYFDDVFNAYLQLEQMIGKTCDGKLLEDAQRIRKNADLDFLKEDIDDMLSETKTGVTRVKTIVEDLRRFSRLDEAESKTIDLIENLRSAIAITRVQMDPKRIRFTFDAPEKLVLNCYPGQLNQAILNILINAIQAVPNEGEVSMKVISDDEQVQILIEDNGPGIPPENQNRIFDPFFTTKPVGSGTGLGLSITYKIIHELHKGSITVQSEPCKNTSFCITIPQKQEKRRMA
jgi:two-component system, NtrC family, sensor kinase